jgi:hypothetical protein
MIKVGDLVSTRNLSELPFVTILYDVNQIPTLYEYRIYAQDNELMTVLEFGKSDYRNVTYKHVILLTMRGVKKLFYDDGVVVLRDILEKL